MTNSNSRNTLSDSDIFLLLCLTPFAVPLVIALVPGWWGKFADLASRAENPCRRVGVATLDVSWQIGGLDLPRLVICGGAVLIAASVCGFSALRALHERRIDRRLASGGDRL